MVATSVAVASTAENKGGISGGADRRGDSIIDTQNLIGDPSLGEVILPGKTRSPRDSAYARFTQGGFRPGGALRSVLLQMLTGNGFSADAGMADATKTNTVANNEGDAGNGATVVKNSVNSNNYGYISYAVDESSEEVSTPLGGVTRVLIEEDQSQMDVSADLLALESHRNKEVTPVGNNPYTAAGFSQSGASSTASDDLPIGGNQYKEAGFSYSALASGGRYSGYGFNHYYGRHRSSAYDSDGINPKKDFINPYLTSMYGSGLDTGGTLGRAKWG